MNDTKYWNPGSGQVAGNFTVLKNIKEKGKGMKTGKAGKILVTLGIVLATILLVVGIVAYMVVIKPAQSVMVQVNALKADSQALKDAITNRDLISLEKGFNKTEEDLKKLKESRDSNFAWAKNFGPTKEYYSDSDHFIQAGNYAIAAGREAVVLVKPFADAAGLKVSEDQKVANTGLADAVATWIGLMPQIANDMDKVLVQLGNVGKELSYVKADKYPESFRGVPLRPSIISAQNTLTKVTDYAPDIKEALTIVPGLLGVATGEQRYMIIMQNDKELRPTGGFWTNYATFKINNALLSSDFSSKDMYSIDLTLDQIDAYYTFGAPPFPWGKYLKIERWYARDANTSPDLPTSVDNFMKSYNLAMKIAPYEIKPVKGIVTIDTQVIRELMNITGPVTLNGVTYNSDNVVLELETIASLTLREQSGRKRVLGDLMGAMLKNVFESENSLWSKLIDKGIDLAARKHIQAYLFDPKGQALLEKYNLAGRIIDPVVGDYSMVVSTNLGADKTNWFVTKNVSNTLANENGKWVRTVKIAYDYKQPSAEYGPFVKRFRDWVRVYAPLGSTLINVEGTEDGSGTETERNKTYFWGYVELGPDETKVLTFKYYLPDGVIKGNDYNLYLAKQAGTNGETYSVTVGGKTDTFVLDTDRTISKKI